MRFWPLRRRAWVPTAGTDADRAPTNSVAPVVSGTGEVDETLSCTRGTWVRAVRYTYQWQSDGEDVDGETSTTYVVREDDVGVNVRCVVTAHNVSGHNAANSNNKAVS